MTCYETVSIAGQTLQCRGGHKEGSTTHSVDYAKLPSGFIIGNLQQQLIDQGVDWVKWHKKPVRG